jgi:hypothetical protein
MHIPTQTELAARFAQIVERMREPIGQRANRGGVTGVLLGFVFWRLVRMVGRLDRLILRWQAGKLRPSRAGQPRKRPEPQPPVPAHLGTPHPKPPRSLRGHAWLIGLAQGTAQASMLVEILIADAEACGLIAAAPQAGRIFRPLCRMLGIPVPPALRLPARLPRPPRARPARAPRPALPPLGPSRPIGFRPSAIGSRKIIA